MAHNGRQCGCSSRLAVKLTSCERIHTQQARAGQGPKPEAHHVEVHVAVDLDADGRDPVVVLVVMLVVMPVIMAVAVAVIMAVVVAVAVIRRLWVAVVVSMLMLMVVAAVSAVLMAMVVAVVVAVLRVPQELWVHLRRNSMCRRWSRLVSYDLGRYLTIAAACWTGLQVQGCTNAALQGCTSAVRLGVTRASASTLCCTEHRLHCTGCGHTPPLLTEERRE
jgi:hypothetical protein